MGLVAFFLSFFAVAITHTRIKKPVRNSNEGISRDIQRHKHGLFQILGAPESIFTRM